MSHEPKIAIVDYGVGNIHSALKAFRRFAPEARVTEEADEIASADALVLPGVGAFEAGMKGLRVRGLVPVVKNFAASAKPMLGICLGAQVMLERGYEFGEHEGLGLIAGEVVLFSGLAPGTKVPHMGWNKIYAPAGKSWNKTVLSKLPDEGEVYFVHSFVLKPVDEAAAIACAEYGGQEFCAVMQKGNIAGCQFHPEKSGRDGLKIIENFVRLVKG